MTYGSGEPQAGASAAPRRPPAAGLTSHDLLGFKITPTTGAGLLELIGETIESGSRCVIASQNLHGIYTYFRDEKFRTLHQAELTCVHIDGMPLVWAARLSGLPVASEHRTACIDWFLPLLSQAAERGWRVYYLGAAPAVVEEGLRRLRERCPGLEVAGRHGFFDAATDSPENRAVVEAINDFAPQVLLVGMGMGRQERWILENLERLQVNCIGTVGACLEYFAGAAATPPRWTGRFGLEWAYRLGSNPRRFAWRYLVEPWLALGLILRHRMRRRPHRSAAN